MIKLFVMRQARCSVWLLGYEVGDEYFSNCLPGMSLPRNGTKESARRAQSLDFILGSWDTNPGLGFYYPSNIPPINSPIPSISPSKTFP